MMSSVSLTRLAGSILACVVVMGACTSSQQTASDAGRDVPTWYLDNRPMDPHHIFAAATATAPKLQVAASQATAKARGDLAATVETKFEGLTKQFQEEVGTGPNAEAVSQFTQTYKSVVSQTISGSEVVKREIRRENGDFRAYVLLRMPIGTAQEQLLRTIENSPTTHTRFRSAPAYDSLAQDVEAHRQREEAQARRRRAADARTDAEAPPPSTERSVEDANTRDGGAAPTADQVQAPDQTAETDPSDAPAQSTEDQQQEGGTPVTKAQRIESALRSAADPWLGVPYKLGGESKQGVDCSALTKALYEQAFDVQLPRTTGQQVNRGRSVGRSQMRAGDLVFFRTADQQKHVGIYLDDRKFVHASSSQGVTVSPLRYDYWQSNYWTARRLSVL
jgi:cell wall-associated NlpC family hydrolase